MNCLIIHETQFTLNSIESNLTGVPFIHSIHTSNSVFDAFEIIRQKEIHLLIVHTNLKAISGVDFVKNLEQKPIVVFLSDVKDFAMEAFELGAIDYMMEDFSKSRLIRTCYRAYQLYEGRKLRQQMQPNKASAPKNFLFVKENSAYKKIFTKDILYIESLKDYVKIHTKDGKLICLNSLKSLCEHLSSDSFLRIHKSYIVSMDKIHLISKKYVLIGDQQIPIGERYKSDFHSSLENNRRFISA